MATYELPLDPDGEPAAEADQEAAVASLSEQLLVANALWFCRLRWGVVGALVVLGTLGCFPAIFRDAGLRLRWDWPLGLAGVLAAYNVLFVVLLRRRLRPAGVLRPAAILWGQIILDLIVLTGVVHFVGSRGTFIAFFFLFHVVLACIFFSRSQSLLVCLLACLLYALCVLGEEVGVLSSTNTIYVQGLLPPGGRSASVLNPLSAMGIWVGVWYLASHLSVLVRKRDNELAATNRRLIAAQEERGRHMLRTTHELKAPFAAIHANTQLLLQGHCGPLPDKALDVARRIYTRCGRLAAEIQEMLQLANLESTGQVPPAPTSLDLAETIAWCLRQLGPVADQRGIVVASDLSPARVWCVEDHLKMLVSNLLSNAIAYSSENGNVRVRCGAAPDGQSVVTIADEGIGIGPDKLEHIFEEHYRTKEAAIHNKQSSGLGLAIVRRVAQTHGIRVRVRSAPGEGTTFELHFPAEPPDEASTAKETRDGLPDDRG